MLTLGELSVEHHYAAALNSGRTLFKGLGLDMQVQVKHFILRHS